MSKVRWRRLTLYALLWFAAVAVTTGLAVTLPARGSSAAAAGPAPRASAQARADCLTCHAPGEFDPMPPSHAEFTSGSCAECHEAASNPYHPGTAPAVGELPAGPVDSAALQGPNSYCLACHRRPDLSMTLPSGEEVSLYADESEHLNSVHGPKINCADCHVRNLTYPHPPLDVPTVREFEKAEYELCKRCHFENYTRTLDSMHYDALAAGSDEAPLCTDCHTAHSVTRLEESPTKNVEVCGKCHDDVFGEYAQSVHGVSLLQQGNLDMPVCITCHGVHRIPSATTPEFHVGSLGLCAECHGDKELMEKYGVSTNVLNTYLNDFHGKTIGFYQKQESLVWPEEPVCVDCHGVHDVRRADDPDSSVMKENLLNTCRKCHEDAQANFPSAWLSHYEPSLDDAPLVFLVKEYYLILIPLMVGGMALHVILDLWRLARNR